MAVFEISSSYQQYGNPKWHSFKGFFVLDEASKIMHGFVEATNPSTSPQRRYIYGIYDRSKEVLAYLQLVNTFSISPLMFLFWNTKQNGIWSAYDQDMGTFFPFRKNNGSAEVTFKEVTNPNEAEEISKVIFHNFGECADFLQNIVLIYKGVSSYMIDMGIY